MQQTNDTELIEVYDGDAFLQKFIPGTSPAVRVLRARIAVFNAAANVPLVKNVLILGESGSGKNYIAEVMAAHRQWLIEKSKSRVDDKLENPLSSYTAKFIEVSLPGLPDELVESELFGHMKGSFTGAFKDHPGIFGDGYQDVLLDEIGDASPRLQSKLLRVLNSGQYRPVGGTKEHEKSADARIIMATHRPLISLTSSGIFREDLLWRIREFVLYVPALRSQTENLPALIQSVLDGLTDIRPEGLEKNPILSEEDIAWATGHTWPGNVRQLRHTLAKWLVYRGTRSLQQVNADGEQDGDSLRATESAHPRLAEGIRRALERARVNMQPISGTIGDFTGTFESQVKRAISQWIEETRPSPEELKAMFPQQEVNSLRTIVKRWRSE